MFTPYDFLKLSIHMTRLGLDAGHVITRRMESFARGDLDAGFEATRMVTEKAMALAEAQMKIAAAAASGHPERAAPRVVALYSRKVRANRRRLGR